MNIKYLIAALLVAVNIQFSFAQKRKKKSKMDEFSYGIGVLIGNSLKTQGVDAETLDMKSFTKAIEAMLEGKDLEMTPQESEKIVQAKMQELAEKAAEAAKAEQIKFFEKNGKKEGITTLESGIQYEVLTSGKGAIPKASDKVTTHYHGTLLDGTVFDSSVQRGQPASFPVGGVIKGWQEILQLMPVGSKWRVFIPSDLAYGPRATGSIPANSALIFEIELISID